MHCPNDGLELQVDICQVKGARTESMEENIRLSNIFHSIKTYCLLTFYIFRSDPVGEWIICVTTTVESVENQNQEQLHLFNQNDLNHPNRRSIKNVYVPVPTV